MSDSAQPELVRGIGRWTLVALVLNSVIGSGIFLLPGSIARQLGGYAPLAYVLGAAAIGVIMAVFAEVSSQYRETGGQYLYARDAFGPFAGIQIGWFFLLVRVTSGAAVLNVFVNYLAEFWPAATLPFPRASVMTALVAGLVVFNYRGVRVGAGISNFFIVVKLLSLALFVAVGLALLKRVPPAQPAQAAGAGAWMEALVAMVFAYGGFESALVPAAEVKNPRRDMAFALGMALSVIALFYVTIHLVAMWSLPNLAQSDRPLADAARAFAGSPGAMGMAIAALLSAYGWCSAAFVTIPRLIYAMGERGDFPRIAAQVHPRFRTPHVAIVFWALLILASGIYGNFMWNAILAGVARLVTYAATCMALIKLRRRDPDATAWRAPFGQVLALCGIGFCGLLALRLTAAHVALMSGVAAIAAFNWLIVRRRGSSASNPHG